MKSFHSFQRFVRSAAVAAAFSIGFGSAAITALMATPTENFGLRLLPAPKNIAIDGKVEDWNLAGGVLAMDDPAKTNEDFGVWIHGAYDADNLYILARWLDKTPLSNPGDTKLDAGWSGDCLQVRVITNYGDKDKEQRNNLTCWRGKDGADLLELDIPSKEAKPAWFTKNGPAGDNLKLKGAKQSLLVNTDGSGYAQEIAVPWKYLTKDGTAPKPGESVILTVEPNFTFGENKNRITVKDIFRPGVSLDRVFTFRAYPTWGVAKLMESGATVDPEPVRLADGRTFPVKLDENLPVVDWTGLVEAKVRPGWMPVTFTLPEASYVSLHIKNAKGQVVRQLVNGELLPAGANTFMWDGLTTPNWNEPGQALEAGTYTWSAIAHPGLQVKLRGVASNSGRVPWDDGKGSNWGGDMGNPVAVDADGDNLMLGWGMAEAGKAAIFTDLEGKPLWGHKRGGIGGARFVALDGGVCYIVDTSTYGGRLAAVYKFTNAMDVVPWTANNSAERGFKELGGMEADATASKGFTVKGGRLYFSTEADGGTVYIADAVSGQFQRKVAVPGASALTANSKGAYVLSESGTKLIFIDGATGAQKTVLEGLKNATSVALQSAGGAGSTGEPENIYVGTASPDSCVHVYATATGKEVRTIGDKGGREDLGVWRPTALRNISGLTVDKKGQLWVAEDEDKPRRFTRWDAATGKLLQEYFGSTHYGASGGNIAPFDPNVMIGEGCEWAMNPVTGKSDCTGVFADKSFNYARFAKGSNGMIYVAGTVPASRPDPTVMPEHIRIYERLGKGDYKLRGTIQARKAVKADKKKNIESKDAYTEFWADANDDQKPQPNEIQTLPKYINVGGYYLWSMNMAPDLTLTVGTPGDPKTPGEGMMISAASFTPCNAPVYDLAKTQPLPPIASAQPSLDKTKLLTVAGESIRMYNVADGAAAAPVWTYPNLWNGVHGSHKAPPAEPGLFRGVFGIVGVAKLPEPIGDVWLFNSNVGEWHALTGNGFYLSRVFNGDWMKIKWPKQAVPGADLTESPSGMGGEDFGGSMTQGDDGKIYIQSGKTALWNVELVGLDKVKLLPSGQLTMTSDDAKKAITSRDEQMQKAVGTVQVEVKKVAAAPEFKSNLNADFKGAQVLSYKKADDSAVRTALAWDSQNLYVAWDVKDSSPWVNSAERPEYMYARGDTVDLQLGTSMKADAKRGEGALGDLRLSIGQIGGNPVAVIYRKVATEGEKQPMTFSSGVIREYVMESVKTVPDAKIVVKKEKASYIVEAAIPLAALGLKASDLEAGVTLRGDVGVTHSDPPGQDTRLRTYWSNQSTGLVDDEVFELKMDPKNWGELKFSK